MQEIILGYFSKKLRAVLQKKNTMNNFDLYILSCKINSGGLWASENKIEDTEAENEYAEDEFHEDQDVYIDDQIQNIEFVLKLFQDGDGFFNFENHRLEK